MLRESRKKERALERAAILNLRENPKSPSHLLVERDNDPMSRMMESLSFGMR